MDVSNAFLLLGTNLGDRVNNLSLAEQTIALKAGKVIAKSVIYETGAWGNEDQPAFLNQALQIETRLPPQELLHVLKEIERTMGRKQSVKWGSRLIDIDILLMDEIAFNSPTLVIPHPQMHKRRFTLVPLAEIAPGLKHPLLGLSIKELLEKCEDKLEVKTFTPSQKTINRGD